MSDQVLQAGSSELGKGIIHVLIFAGHMMCFAYNLLAYVERPAPHLRRNVVAHLIGMGWELGQVRDHLK